MRSELAPCFWAVHIRTHLALCCFILKQILVIDVKVSLLRWHADHGFWLLALVTWPYKHPAAFLPESQVPFSLLLLPSFLYSVFDSGPIVPTFISSSLDCEVSGKMHFALLMAVFCVIT